MGWAGSCSLRRWTATTAKACPPTWRTPTRRTAASTSGWATSAGARTGRCLAGRRWSPCGGGGGGWAVEGVAHPSDYTSPQLFVGALRCARGQALRRILLTDPLRQQERVTAKASPGRGSCPLPFGEGGTKNARSASKTDRVRCGRSTSAGARTGQRSRAVRQTGGCLETASARGYRLGCGAEAIRARKCTPWTALTR
jgi:hypothetical protein